MDINLKRCYYEILAVLFKPTDYSMSASVNRRLFIYLCIYVSVYVCICLFLTLSESQIREVPCTKLRSGWPQVVYNCTVTASRMFWNLPDHCFSVECSGMFQITV